MNNLNDSDLQGKNIDLIKEDNNLQSQFNYMQNEFVKITKKIKKK